MRLLFGSEFDYDRLGLAMVAAGMGLHLSATTVNQAVLAQGRAPGRRAGPSRRRSSSDSSCWPAWRRCARSSVPRLRAAWRCCCTSSTGARWPANSRSGPARRRRWSDPGRRRRGQLGAGRLGDRPVRLRRVRHAEDRRAGDEQRRPGVPHGGCGEGADAAVDLDRRSGPTRSRSRLTLSGEVSMNAWPPNPDSRSCRARGPAGPRPRRQPRPAWRVDRKAGQAPGVPDLLQREVHVGRRLGLDRDRVGARGGELLDLALRTLDHQMAVENAARAWTCSRMDSTITGPIVIGGTKCPSITSTWMARAPASITMSSCSPSRAVGRQDRRLDLLGADPPGHSRPAAWQVEASDRLQHRATAAHALHLIRVTHAHDRRVLAAGQ